MILPLRSDCAIDHEPYGTLSIIAANCLIFVAFLAGWIGESAIENWWILPHGSITPLHWFTSTFAHGGVIHLLGNMVFLWTFGLIVEGHIGSKCFALVYFGIAAVSGLLEQLIMLGGGPGSIGASGVIMGLMAMSMLWAPRNELDCVLFIRLAPIFFSARVSTIAGFFLLWDLAMASWSGFAISSSLLHLIGAAVGFFTGWMFLKRHLVDCRGWDLLTIRRYGRPRRDLAKAELERIREERRQKGRLRRR